MPKKIQLGRLTTTPISGEKELKLFFDRFAPTYSERHGSPQRMLNLRLNLIRRWANPNLEDVVLDLGCGPGHHLMALHSDIGGGIGIDFSGVMIDIARERLKYSTANGKLTFRMDDARSLSTVRDRSVDIAMCIGSLEHMLDQNAVLRHAHRVLKPGGRFVCLTPNADYIWYRILAPWLGADTRHLSTDKFLTESKLERLLAQVGFHSIDMGRWSFIPRGDLHPLMGTVLTVLGTTGRVFGRKNLQGGLVASAVKDHQE